MFPYVLPLFLQLVFMHIDTSINEKAYLLEDYFIKRIISINVNFTRLKSGAELKFQIERPDVILHIR
jgi:hypothetical protein